MKVKMLIQENVFDALNASFHEAWDADQGYHVGLMVDTDFLSYVTSGRNLWTLTKEGNEFFLSYKGSRLGFLDGCNAVKVERKGETVVTVLDYDRKRSRISTIVFMGIYCSWQSRSLG